MTHIMRRAKREGLLHLAGNQYRTRHQFEPLLIIAIVVMIMIVMNILIIKAFMMMITSPI